MIKYHVDIIDQYTRTFKVTLLTEQPKKEITLQFPTWIPGSYMIRDFSKHIFDLKFEAFNNTEDLRETKIQSIRLNNHSWKLKSKKESIFKVTYQVYAWDYSVRGACIDNSYAFFNGPSLFFEVLEFKDMSHHLNVSVTCENFNKNIPKWRVVTGMTRNNVQKNDKNQFIAKDFQEFIDMPVLIGDFETHSFRINKVPHHIVLVGKYFSDINKLIQDVEKICQSHFSLFQELPFDEYTFMLLITEEGYGGLEHRNSTLLMASHKDLPIATPTGNRKNYIKLLGLFSHEYFHSWNIKKIRPKEYITYDLSKPVPSRLLWAFEGFTTYYDDLMLARSKVISREEYLTTICEGITQLLRTPGDAFQTITDSSYDAWTKFYQQNENSVNTIVSYYIKGSLIGLLLDLHLRINSKSKFSLDLVMLKLWKSFGKHEIGVGEEDIQKIIADLGGEEITKLLDLALNTTDPLPLNFYLEKIGLSLKVLPRDSHEILGCFNLDLDKNEDALLTPTIGSLGIRYIGSNRGILVQRVISNSCAQKAGIWANDEIIAINDIGVTSENLSNLLSRFGFGEKVQVYYFRRGVLHCTEIIFNKTLCLTAYLSDNKNLKREVEIIQENWLNS